MRKIAVYKIVLGDGTLASLDERRFEGIKMNSTLKQEMDKIRAVNGAENKVTYSDRASAVMHYERFRYTIFEVV